MTRFINKQKALISNLRAGNPSQKIKVIGVTGSRGKTVVTELLYHLFKNAGMKVGFISSTGYTDNMEEVQNDLSANFVEAGELHTLLDSMIKNQLEFAIVEMTAKNLLDKKYEGLTLDSGIITNIIGDDSSYFQDWFEYANTKLEFISKIRDKGLLILNDDEPQVVNWLLSQGDNLDRDVYVYPISSNETKVEEQNLARGSTFVWDDRKIITPSSHKNAILNNIQAIKLAESYKPDPKMASYTENFSIPKGRMEVIESNPFTVIIDYAYTPSMLEDSLEHISELKDPNAKIITVFGCAGEREHTRRQMGAISAKYSDITILTAEDPKSEKVFDINSEIVEVAQNYGGVLVERISSTDEYKMVNKDNLKQRIERVTTNQDHPIVAFDADDFTSRLDAINFAIKHAQPGDVVYITGKGHESTLAFDGIEYEWSDHEAVKVALNQLTI
ncbi:MAG: Mur ligase family protein [Candidatus Dojkabacteria bacterium]